MATMWPQDTTKSYRYGLIGKCPKCNYMTLGKAGHRTSNLVVSSLGEVHCNFEQSLSDHSWIKDYLQWSKMVANGEKVWIL